MSYVSLIRKENYDDCYTSIKKLLEHLGNDLIEENSSVFIKLNCVGTFDKNLAITTHPDIFEAVVRIVKEKTNNITIGDNPATKDITNALRKCGLYDVCLKHNLKIFNPKDTITIKNSNFKLYQSFEVSREMVENDIIINLPKLKTHGLTYMSCAVKNFFGLIYGLEKASWHSKASNPLVFGDALVDLYGAFLEAHKGKVISICDGILALDGDGPATGGKPKNANCLLASLNAVSLDYVACDLIKLDQNKAFVTKIALKRNLSSLEDIKIVGDSLNEFKDIKFEGPSGALPSFGLKILKIAFFRNLVLEYPIITNKCIRCYECVKICPAKTITKINGKNPKLKKAKCIRCFCCMEVCPVNAFKKSRRPIIGKIFL